MNGKALVEPPPAAPYFATTRWSVILTAAAAQPSAATGDRRKAWQELCTIYWRPVFAFLRRRGHSPENAQDTTQDFFLELLTGELLDGVERGRGRFRAFLLTSLQNFVADARDRARTQKRGGQCQFLSWDALRGAGASAWEEPADEWSPETAFDVRWAQALVGHALASVRQVLEKRGKAATFDALRPFLTGLGDPGEQARAAARLGLSPTAARVALHRLREQYRRRLREEVARTVAAPGDVGDELRHLAAVLRREGSGV